MFSSTEAPAPIVSENVQPAVEPLQKSSELPVPAGQTQAEPQQPQQEALAQTQERSAPESTAVPIQAVAAESTVAPVADLSSGASSEKKLDEQDSSSSSSEESKESQEDEKKKTA